MLACWVASEMDGIVCLVTRVLVVGANTNNGGIHILIMF
jgi:hypothetical protein